MIAGKRTMPGSVCLLTGFGRSQAAVRLLDAKDEAHTASAQLRPEEVHHSHDDLSLQAQVVIEDVHVVQGLVDLLQAQPADGAGCGIEQCVDPVVDLGREVGRQATRREEWLATGRSDATEGSDEVVVFAMDQGDIVVEGDDAAGWPRERLQGC